LKEVFNNPEHSLVGLDAFSHVWVIFNFHLNKNKGIKAKVKPPRLNGLKTGVFSTRSPHRPNPIGLSLAKIESIKDDVINLSGIDIVDGTPILDIKPYIPSYDSISELKFNENESVSKNETNLSENNNKNVKVETAKVAGWVNQNSILQISFTPRSMDDITNLKSSKKVVNEEQIYKAITEVLCEDPRSIYRRHKCKDRLYYFTVECVHVTTWFDESTLPTTAEILRVKYEDETLSTESPKLDC